jgi:hypothetical protein
MTGLLKRQTLKKNGPPTQRKPACKPDKSPAPPPLSLPPKTAKVCLLADVDLLDLALILIAATSAMAGYRTRIVQRQR